jgi:hypothetical protein
VGGCGNLFCFGLLGSGLGGFLPGAMAWLFLGFIGKNLEWEAFFKFNFEH